MNESIFVIFRDNDPMYHLGFFTASGAARLDNEFKTGPKSRYSVRQIQPRRDLPDIHIVEAWVLLSNPEIVGHERIPAEPASTMSWIAPREDRAYGRGYTEEEAIDVARRARECYLNPSLEDDFE